MVSLKLELGTEAVVDLPVIVCGCTDCDRWLVDVALPLIFLFMIRFGSTLVYHGLSLSYNAKASFDLTSLCLIHLTLYCFVHDWLVVFNLFVDRARLRRVVRNLTKPLQAFLLLSGSELWGPQWKVITFAIYLAVEKRP